MLSSRPGAIYQQDNARPHTARLSQQCLQGYDVLPWPARSPDLSPIEHFWDAQEGNCSRLRRGLPVGCFSSSQTLLTFCACRKHGETWFQGVLDVSNSGFTLRVCEGYGGTRLKSPGRSELCRYEIKRESGESAALQKQAGYDPESKELSQMAGSQGLKGASVLLYMKFEGSQQATRKDRHPTTSRQRNRTRVEGLSVVRATNGNNAGAELSL
ncbi:uncharacterized protein TNCV_2566361 [Trichonephila clavipes]|uniref:Uncharacterized protein n=1 Tax=Trichonephila clavipes TaxID=2585209 RepID=A0A8X6WK83_TRICX|nr:uncharacterized protein TNCV_2566361 [Trichonephila clavipes]